MDSAPPLDLPLAFEALHQRATKERTRLHGVAVPGTESVGGWAQIGKRLDVLLRVTFTLVCIELGRSPDGEFRRLTENEAWTLDRAMAGQLAYVLPLLARDAPPQKALVRAVIEAAHDAGSPLRRCIEGRNAMVHGHAPRPTAELVALLDALIAWSAKHASLG
jgi:hypothetical protein